MSSERRHAWVDIGDPTPYVVAAFGDGVVSEFAPLSGGLCNTNYRFGRHGMHYVLRLYTHDREGCARDAALAQWLPRSVPVPALCFSAPEADPWPYSISRFVPGVPLARTTRVAGQSVGAILAALHGQPFEHYGFLGPDLKVRPWAQGRDGYLDHVLDCLPGPAAERLGQEATGQLESLVRTQRNRLQDLPGPALCHGDFNKRNLLVDDRGLLTAVLDWDFVHAGLPLSDVANLFRYGAAPEFEQGFEDGYRAEGGVLPTDWKALGRLLDLANLVEFLSVLERPTLAAEVRGLVEATLQALR